MDAELALEAEEELRTPEPKLSDTRDTIDDETGENPFRTTQGQPEKKNRSP
jgi:hypothetical protein